ncbi:MAG TPA: (d)CMP kinase [Bacteroidales bacterium]|nr:MAG: Cytidylate kinase [Bacteroidetes bacterium ADurb.Bin217]HPM12135.1 (d)CMP kinase [Bacteroidales bacterium]
MIIAIDGYSSCGKSTIAKGIAKELGYTYIDTGAMYRAVTLFCLQNNSIQQNEINEFLLKKYIDTLHISFVYDAQTQTQQTYLNGVNVEHEIRRLEVANWVSPVSKIGFVRQKLVAMQRELAAHGNIVMDGRDIGTVVFPHADYKFFITASAQIRAQRRYDELLAKGEQVNFEEVLHNIEQRDLIDTTRTESPLTQAEDAIVFDTSNVTREQQLEWILEKIRK